MKIIKILIVEDDFTLRELMVDILTGEGFHCLDAPDGLAASELLKQETIDLLITDFRMPHMSGVDLLNWCREKKLHFPVIFITANVDLLPVERFALSDCCAALLSKPIGIEDILTAISQAEKRDHRSHCV